MFQIVLALVAIGLALFLWQVFPAFKWVVAVIIAVPIIWLTAGLANNKIYRMNIEKKEAQEAKERAVQIEIQAKTEEKRKIESFEQFDALAKKQKNDMAGNEDIFLSSTEKGVVILAKDLCKMGGQSYKNLQASFLMLSDGKRIDSCWAYSKKVNEIVLITHTESESFKSEIGFNYFKPVIWDAEKQKFMDKP